MKDLLSKEHCCYKIYTLIVRSAYPPPFYGQAPYMDYPLNFTRKSRAYLTM